MTLRAQPLPLDASRRQWFAAACAQIDAGRLTRLVADLTNIHSPTGAERQASEFLAAYMTDAGLNGVYQPINERSGNCHGRIHGDGSGPSLMLYAPIDTHLDGEPAIDVPWVGPGLRADMVPAAECRDDMVIGLGASNPKSMIASLVEAAHCIHAAQIPLSGDLLIASCGGGMPWVARERDNAGISSGVMHLLTHGISADYGVIFKPWDEIYYEHPGMVWFKVTTWGTMGYSGIPRGVPGFRSSIVPAARVILALEEWLATYPDSHSSTQVRPEGWIAAVRSGWPDKPAFPGAACEIYLDVRTNPDQTMAELEAEFAAVMRRIMAENDNVDATWEMTVSCRGARTDPDNWIVQSGLRGWELIHDRPYPGAPAMSGQTDAATICNLGIPLLRIGYPFLADTEVPVEFREGLGGMGVAKIPELIDSIKQAIYIVIDTCTRTREETGLHPA